MSLKIHVIMIQPLTQKKLKATYTKYFKQEHLNKKCINISKSYPRLFTKLLQSKQNIQMQIVIFVKTSQSCYSNVN